LENDGKIKSRNGNQVKLKKALMTSAAASQKKKLKKNKSKSTANATQAAGDGTGFTDSQTAILKECFNTVKRARRNDEDGDFMQAMQTASAPPGPKGFKSAWIQNQGHQQQSNVMQRLGTTNSNTADAIDQLLDSSCL
jgi:hypothetical protein